VRISAGTKLGAGLVLLFLSFWTLFFRLGSLPLSGADEPRYARIAQEMQQQGRWITPTLEGKPWLEKPPLYYWITIPIYAVLGHSETTARLGTAAFALLTVLAVFWMAARLWSPLAGFLSAVILLTSFGFAGYGRSASMDMLLTACLTVALSVLAVAAARRDLASWKLWPAYVSLGLAILAKGPVALALAAGIAILFWCFDERGGSLRLWHPVSGLIIAAAVSLPWYWLAFRQNGFSFISIFFINHNVARFVSDIHHHSQPFYYYVPVLLGMLFPWSGWLPVLVRDSPMEVLRRWKNWSPPTLFLICWIVFPLVFFSFSVSKLAGYILPVLPPLAVLLGARFAALWESSALTAGGWASWLFLGLTAALAVAAPVAFDRAFDGNWKAGLWIACAAIVPGTVAFLFGRRGWWKHAFIATGAQAVMVVITVVVAAYPALGDHYSTRDVANTALRVREPGESIATYRFFNHTLHYYTGYQVTEEFQDSASLKRFIAGHHRVLVVTEAGSIPELERTKDLEITTLFSQSNFRLIRIQSPMPTGSVRTSDLGFRTLDLVVETLKFRFPTGNLPQEQNA